MSRANLDEKRKQMYQKFASIQWKHHQCGRGSVFENTKKTRQLLENITKKYNIKTVSDAGAGDLSWIHAVNWNVEYTPYDIRKWHPDIVEFDITKDILPKTDLIICRHVLNHLGPGPDLAKEARDRFEESGSKYLFITCTKIEFWVERWGEPLEFESEIFPGGRTWCYGLWLMNNE